MASSSLVSNRIPFPWSGMVLCVLFPDVVMFRMLAAGHAKAEDPVDGNSGGVAVFRR
jgi:hypothetical protein